MLSTQRRLAPARPWLPPLLFLLGCASREAPARYPDTSAASLQAPAGAPAHVTQSLASDPPLPGEESRWQGLEEAPPATRDAGGPADPHARHRGDHAH